MTQLADGSPLTNVRTFTFAVSAVDAFGNTGPLSGGVAATPAPGPAEPGGGGGCAVNGTAPWSTHAGALAAGLLALLAVRRARRYDAPRREESSLNGPTTAVHAEVSLAR